MTLDLTITLVVWILEMLLFFGICYWGYKRFDFKEKRTHTIMFLFFLLLWMSMKIVYEYQYLLIDDLISSGEDVVNNLFLWTSLSFTLSIMIFRYPMTWYGNKWHKKSIILLIALFFIIITSSLMTAALWVKSVKSLNIVIIFSSISLGIVYGSFTSVVTMTANLDRSKNPFFSITLLVFAMFGANAILTPLKTATVYSVVSDPTQWEGYKMLYLSSAAFGVSALTGIIYLWKNENYPDYLPERKQIKKKTLKKLNLKKDKEETVNFFGKEIKMLSTTKSWWKILIPLSLFGFMVVFIFELMGTNQFGTIIITDLFESHNYSEIVEYQLTSQLSSLFSLFIFLGLSASTFYLIPNVGFRNTLRTGFGFILIYAVISGFNMIDSNLHSPVLMFILYAILGIGFGMTYYVIIGYVLLLDITNPIKEKVSGLGLWLLVVGFAYIIAEMIFLNVVINSDGSVNKESLGIIMFVSAFIVGILYAMLNYFEKEKDGSIYKKARRKIYRDPKAII